MVAINPDLERQYNNRALVPEHPAIFERWRRNSAEFRAQANATIDLHYGEAERHRLDLFHAPNPRGTVVFIHGGYWRSLDKSDFSFVAAPFIQAGLSVAAFNYRLCPSVTVADTANDCRAALEWLLKNGAHHQMPVDRIALSGHSAGGHLVAMLYATDWAARGVDASSILGGVSIGGVFDLEPLLQCSMNVDLRLASAAEARAVSPIHLEAKIAAPLYLVVGGAESAAFREQTQLLHRAWPATCPAADEMAGCNHFTVVDDFARADSRGHQFIEELFR